MVLQTELEIHNQLVRYLADEISLDEFRDWFDQTTWDLDLSKNALAAEIELRLAEYSSGHRDEAELRKLLRPLAQTVITCGAAVTGTSGTDVTLGWGIAPDSSVDIRVSLVSS